MQNENRESMQQTLKENFEYMFDTKNDRTSQRKNQIKGDKNLYFL